MDRLPAMAPNLFDKLPKRAVAPRRQNQLRAALSCEARRREPDPRRCAGNYHDLIGDRLESDVHGRFSHIEWARNVTDHWPVPT